LCLFEFLGAIDLEAALRQIFSVRMYELVIIVDNQDSVPHASVVARAEPNPAVA
jgi:hypothetical protein